MSTDLDFCPDLPQIRSLKIRSAPKSADEKPAPPQNNTNTDREVEEEGCRTPTAEEHKIPRIKECPAAPRKAKRAVSCKRKLVEFDFFEAVNRDEVDGFFRASFDDVVKRRCPCK